MSEYEDETHKYLSEVQITDCINPLNSNSVLVSDPCFLVLQSEVCSWCFCDEVEGCDVEKVKTEHNEFEEEELQNHQAQF